MAPRTIIKTDTAGWFEDPTTGKKTRKKDGDVVMTGAEYAQTLLDADPSKTAPAEQPEQPEAKAATNGGKAKDPQPEVTLTTGKVTTGATLTRKCAWVDPDKRTDAQAKLFDANFKGVKPEDTYDKVKAAAGGKRSALPDGTVRVLKPQDAFQVRFCPENQQKWRAELRRRKNRQRAAKARKAAAK